MKKKYVTRLKKYFFLPIYNDSLKNPSCKNIVEKYFFDLYNLKKNQFIIEDLSYNKKSFVKNFFFINKKKKIYKEEILNNLKKNKIISYKNLESCVDFWLIHFLSIIKLRFDKLSLLKKKYSNLHLPYYDFHEFVFYRTDDFLKCFRANSVNNIYIYQVIAKKIGIKTIECNNKILIPKFKSKQFKKKIKFYFLSILLKFVPINLFLNLYANHSNLISKLLFYVKNFSLIYDVSILYFPYNIKKNNKKINIKIKEKDLFDKIANTFISDFFPKILYSNDSLSPLFNLQKNLKTLSSSIGLICSDEYRFLASFLKKSNINTYQHGSDYGILKHNFLNDFEKKFSNFRDWTNKKSYNLFFQKINDNKNYKSDLEKKPRKKKITFYSSVLSHNPIRCESIYIDFQSNLNNISNVTNFYKRLNGNLKKNLIIRNQKRDYGWNYKKIFFQLTQKNNFVNFCNSKVSFEAMKESRIFISDHISTSFYEALELNMPSFVFCNLENYIFSERAKKAFLTLKKNNIIFDNSVSCSIFLNRHYDEIEKFWYSKDLQNSLKKFKKICFYNN